MTLNYQGFGEFSGVHNNFNSHTDAGCCVCSDDEVKTRCWPSNTSLFDETSQLLLNHVTLFACQQ